MCAGSPCGVRWLTLLEPPRFTVSTGSRGVRWLTLLEPPRFTVSTGSRGVHWLTLLEPPRFTVSTGSRGVRWLTLLEPPRFTVNRSVPPSSAIWRCSRESRAAVAHSRQSLCVVRNRSVTSSTSEREPGASSTRTYWLPLKLRVTAAETTATLAS